VALARRVARRRHEEADLRGDGLADTPREIHVEAVADPSDLPAVGPRGGWPGVGWNPEPFVAPAPAPGVEAAARPVLVSAAVRIAAVRPPPPIVSSPSLDAVIAWLHAYETYGRYRRFAAMAVAVAAALAVIKLRSLGG
jgi:hypothetical protein